MSIGNIIKLGSIIIVGAGAIAFASEYPKSKQEKLREEIGSMAGEDGIVFRPFNSRNEETKSVVKGEKKVNKYLWEATRFVLKFMPISSFDANNGIIVTDWYSSKAEPNYSYKIEVTINDNIISPDAIEVNVYEKRLKGGQWYNEPMSSTLSYKFEDQIIRKARELYIKAKDKN
jgi:hypothetical protein